MCRFFFKNGSLNLPNGASAGQENFQKLSKVREIQKVDDLMQHDVMLGVFYDNHWLY